MKNKIYTKTGDKGKTSLFGGSRVNKFDLRVETYGIVDELNSAIGLTVAQLQKAENREQKGQYKIFINQLKKIQSDLLTIGSSLANPNNPKLSQFARRIKQIENQIDEMTEQVPELKNFILPGGSLSGAQLHMARTICRRAERRIVELKQKAELDELIISYFNRLSDFLFIAARFINHLEKKKETIWKGL